VLRVGGDLDGVPGPLLEDSDLGTLHAELPL